MTNRIVDCQELKDLYAAFSEATSQNTNQPEALNLMNLQKAAWKFDVYPSQSQILEIHYACSNGSHQGKLDFHEFCLLVCSVLYHLVRRKHQSECVLKPPKPSRSISLSHWNVFLGGACNPTTWRSDIAIPFLKENNMTFYNPQVTDWSPKLVELEAVAKAASQVLLFVLDKRTRGVASMVEVAYLAGQRRNLILVMPIDCQNVDSLIDNEHLTAHEVMSLQRSYCYLRDLMERYGYPIFTDLMNALECTKQLISTGGDVRDLSASAGAVPVRHGDINVAKCMTTLREQFRSLDADNSGFITHKEAGIGLRVLLGSSFQLPQLPPEAPECRYDFREFCLLYCREVRCCLNEMKLSSNRRPGSSSDPSHQKKLCHKEGKENPHVFAWFLWKPILFFFLWMWTMMCKMSSPSKNGKTSHRRRVNNPKTFSGGNKVEGKPSQDDEYARCPPLGSSSCLTTHVYDIYLGGTCGTSQWRETIGIPRFLRKGLRYFNPNYSGSETGETTYDKKWTYRLLPSEVWHREHCRVMLFVITKETFSTGSLIECAFYIGIGRRMVLCVDSIEADNVGDDVYDPSNGATDCVTLSQRAVNDHNRGRRYLISLANHAGVPVLDSVEAAVDKVMEMSDRLQ